MIDTNTLITLLVIGLLLLIADCGLGIFMKLRLLHKCRVTCEDSN